MPEPHETHSNGVANHSQAASDVNGAQRPASKNGSKAATRLDYWSLFGSHALIDVFPILLSSLLWPLRERLDLTPSQVTFVIMATPIFSGALQPFFAWLTDKYDTRLCGPLGLAIGAASIGSIGFAQSFWQLAVLQVIGVIAVGFYHPISTALAGQAGTHLFRNGRAQAIGIFISAGMAGHAAGSMLGPWINSLDDGQGMPYLIWLVPPCLVAAIVLHLRLRHVGHRHDNHSEIHASFAPGESARRWRAIAVLTVQNALRFTFNVGILVIMLNVWAKSKLVQSGAFGADKFESAEAAERALANAAALQNGYLGAALTIGMGISVLTTGRVIKRGREWGPLVYLSLIGAAFAMVLGPVGDLMYDLGGFSLWLMAPVYLCTGLTAIGFFATFPPAASLAQRLQPGHTSLVTSLMMGAGWAFSSLCAPLAYLFFGMTTVSDAPNLEPWRINVAFAGFGGLLLVASALTLLIPRDLVAKAADHH